MRNKLFISLLKKRNQNLLQLLVISIFIIVFNINSVVFCMEKEHLGQIMLACEGLANNMYTQEQIQALLTQVNAIQDPAVLERIRQRITIIAGQYNVDMNAYLLPHLQHPTTLPGGNSGVPVEEVRNSVPAIILFVGLSLLGYVIYRNIDVIRDLLFDIGQRALESISPIALELTQHQLTVLLNNPASHQATIEVLVEILGYPGLPA